MEAALYNVYDKTSKAIDDKLLEFASVLNRIGKDNLEHLDSQYSITHNSICIIIFTLRGQFTSY